jgi:hypothetical protein
LNDGGSLWSAGAWYRFGSPLVVAPIVSNQAHCALVPKFCGSGDDYQSGTKLPHSKGFADLIYAQDSITWSDARIITPVPRFSRPAEEFVIAWPASLASQPPIAFNWLAKSGENHATQNLRASEDERIFHRH